MRVEWDSLVWLEYYMRPLWTHAQDVEGELNHGISC